MLLPLLAMLLPAAASPTFVNTQAVQDAKARPGAHPNIDLLLRVLEANLSLPVVVEMNGDES